MKQQFHWVKSASAASILALSLTVAYLASSMNVYSDYGPGPGFFPLVLSLLISILTLIWLLMPVGEGEIPEALTRDAIARVATILLSVALATWLMPYLGFFVTSCLTIFAITVVTGRHSLYFAAALAAVSSLAFQLLFKQALGVTLPAGEMSFISSLGL